MISLQISTEGKEWMKLRQRVQRVCSQRHLPHLASCERMQTMSHDDRLWKMNSPTAGAVLDASQGT